MNSSSDTGKTAHARTQFAWISVLLLFVSLIAPIAQAPIIGTINVFGLGGTAYWLLGLAVAAGAAALAKLYRLLLVPGLLVIAIALFYMYLLERAKADLVRSTAGDGVGALIATLASASVHIQWGLPLLMLSGVTLIVAGMLRNDANSFWELIEVNQIQFIEGAVGLTVLLFTVAALPSMLRHELPRNSLNANEELARRVTAAIVNNNMRPVEEDFGVTLRPELENATKVGRLSQDLNELGAFRSITEDTPTGAAPPYHHFQVRFERGTWLEDITYDAKGKIFSFHVHAPAQQL
jgi:hypothetical protein